MPILVNLVILMILVVLMNLVILVALVILMILVVLVKLEKGRVSGYCYLSDMWYVTSNSGEKVDCHDCDMET